MEPTNKYYAYSANIKTIGEQVDPMLHINPNNNLIIARSYKEASNKAIELCKENQEVLGVIKRNEMIYLV